MTPKHATYDSLCATQLNIHPKAWEELTNTDAFLYRTIAYPLIDEDVFTPAYKEGGTRPGASPALLLSLLIYRSQHQLGLDETMRQLHFNQECQLFTNSLGMCRTDMPESDRILSRFQSRAKDYAEVSGEENPIDVNYQKFTVACCALTGADLSVLRSDSTPVSGNFKIRTSEELMYVALTAGIDYLNAYGTEAQKAAISEGRLAKYNDLVFSENVFTYHWAASNEERRETLCLDADAFIDILEPADHEVPSIALTLRVIHEHTMVGEDNKRVFRAKGDAVLKGNLVQSILDLNATYRVKDKKPLWGYTLNIVEERNPLTHIIINSTLRPNKEQDSDMEKEAYAQLPAFTNALDDFYAQYPALIKGDAYACQRVVDDVLQSLKADFLHETSTLYDLIQAHSSDEKVRSQQKKALMVLDSFYPRLKNHTPMPSVKMDAADPADNGESGTTTKESNLAKSATDSCHRTATDWGHIGKDAIDWDNPEFAKLSDGLRRNYYLGKIAEKPENAFKLPVNQHVSVSDAAYAPSTNEAKEAGYTLFTTNLLGRKGSPITVLFEQEDGKYVTCPRGNRVEKQSIHSNGSICLWLKKSCCENCPCAADCAAKFQKRGDMATVLINPHAIPAIISEAKMSTDAYQCLGDIRNGTECTMSYFKNVYHCDHWPIGMAIKDRMSKDMVAATNLRNLFLAIRHASRVHPNTLLGDLDSQRKHLAKAKGNAHVA